MKSSKNNTRTVAPEKVYDFLKVIWPNFGTEIKPENLTVIICTLSDTDFVRLLSENMEFGDKAQLSLLEKKYSWRPDGDLPEWLEKTENRLLLVKGLVVSNL